MICGKRMRVLHVYKLYSPVRGGGISSALSIIEGLKDRVHSTVLTAVPRGLGYRETVGAADVHRVASIGYFHSMPLAPTLPLWLHVHARRADLVHIHLPFPIADLAINLWQPRVPVVLHWHSEIIQQTRIKRLLRPMLLRTLTQADSIIVGSPRHIESSRDLAAFEYKCQVIPYGVEIEYWQDLDADSEHEVAVLRERFPRMILFAGRLVAYKGVQYLLQAMAQVDADLLIVGDGPLDSALRAQAQTLGVAGRVHFMSEVSDSRLKTLYHACNVFVLPSVWPNEAFGLCQLEAMACGTPIINTNLSTGVPWVARHTQEALTVEPEDPQGLAASINQLLNHPEQAKTMGCRGLERVRSVFDQSKTNQRIYDLYRDLTAVTDARQQVRSEV